MCASSPRWWPLLLPASLKVVALPCPCSPALPEATKKVTVTLKPSLVGSRLPPIASLDAALPGSRSHGVVTGATDIGVFVAFYGGAGGEPLTTLSLSLALQLPPVAACLPMLLCPTVRLCTAMRCIGCLQGPRQLDS
jgi:hypothetical protein